MLHRANWFSQWKLDWLDELGDNCILKHPFQNEEHRVVWETAMCKWCIGAYSRYTVSFWICIIAPIATALIYGASESANNMTYDPSRVAVWKVILPLL